MCSLRVGNQLSQCSGSWMWEMKERRSVVDYILLSRGLVMDRMMVEDRRTQSGIRSQSNMV